MLGQEGWIELVSCRQAAGPPSLLAPCPNVNSARKSLPIKVGKKQAKERTVEPNLEEKRSQEVTGNGVQSRTRSLKSAGDATGTQAGHIARSHHFRPFPCQNHPHLPAGTLGEASGLCHNPPISCLPHPSPSFQMLNSSRKSSLPVIPSIKPIYIQTMQRSTGRRSRGAQPQETSWRYSAYESTLQCRARGFDSWSGN